MLKKIVLFTGCFFALVNINAQRRKYANEFLNIGVGARGLGMSGAQAATVNDVTSTFWNPAGLIGINSDFQVGLMHSEYFGGISKYDYLGTAFPMKNKKGVIGLSLIRLAVDDIPYTLNIIQPDGTVDYSKLKSISSSDYAGVITYAQKLKIKRFEGREDVNMNIGGNFKIIHRNVGELANAWGAGIDIGFQARVKKWKIGINAKDITTTYTLWNFSFTDREKQVLAQTGNEIVSKSTESVFTPDGQSSDYNPEVKIYNNTSKTLTLKMNTELFYFSPHETKNISLYLGEYDFRASAPGVIPYIGTDNLTGNQSYSLQF